MDEFFNIEDLQKRLMEIQEEKPKILLSERNTMEILDYIKKDIEFQIVSTNDGKDFMTIDYLDTLIYETCQLHKKLRIIELENLINISSKWIESRVKNLCQKYNLYFQNNQFLTKDYINKILQEVEDTLKQYKICQLREVANKHDIDMQYLKSFFVKQNPINIEYQIDGRTNQIMSKRFFDSLDRKVKGYLIGKTSPITIQNLHEIFQIDQHILSNYFQNEKFNIKNNLLYPQSFEKNKERKINDYLTRNHIVNYKLFAQEFFITKPEEYLKKSKLRQDDLFLKNQSISKDYLEDIIIQMEQVIREVGFCDFNDYCTENFQNDNQQKVNNYIIERLQKDNIKIINNKNFFMAQKTFQDIKRKLEQNLLQKMPKSVFLESDQIKQRLNTLENIQQYDKDNFLQFLVDRLKETINFKKLKEKSKNQTKKQIIKGFDLNLVPISNLITKTEQVCNYYILLEKSFQILLKKQENKQQLEIILEKTKIITLQNIVFLILRKFQNIVHQDDQNNFEEEQFFQIEYLMKPLFQDNQSLLSYFKVLPKEIKQVFYTFQGIKGEVENFDFLIFKDFDLTKFLNENGQQITIGQFQINKQKKLEKKFVQDLLNQYENYYEDLDKIDNPYKGMMAQCLIEYLESGYVMGYMSNYDDIKQVYLATKNNKNTKFSLLVQELQPRFEEFEEIMQNNDETELEIFFEDLQEIDDESDDD